MRAKLVWFSNTNSVILLKHPLTKRWTINCFDIKLKFINPTSPHPPHCTLCFKVVRLFILLAPLSLQTTLATFLCRFLLPGNFDDSTESVISFSGGQLWKYIWKDYFQRTSLLGKTIVAFFYFFFLNKNMKENGIFSLTVFSCSGLNKLQATSNSEKAITIIIIILTFFKPCFWLAPKAWKHIGVS